MCKVTVAVSTTGESLLGRGGRGRPNCKVQSSHGCVGNSRRSEKSTVNRDGSCFADRSFLYHSSSHLVFSIGWIFSPPTSWATSFGSAWRMTKMVIFIC